MEKKLGKALLILDFREGDLLLLEAVKALFEYFFIAGYLSEELINQAVDYLALAKPFAKESSIVKQDLLTAISPQKQTEFVVDHFLDEFGKQDYFSVGDIIELIVFLQQTAFDRKFGEERDRLKSKPWMELHAGQFIQCATHLGITTEHVPQQKNYLGIGIMGAASFRVRTRLEYFNTLKVTADTVWALSGERELSKGLDEEKVMKELAHYLQKEEKYETKKVGTDTRDFLAGVTETQMVNFLIQQVCPGKQIGMLDSKKQDGHWRATTSQNATDMVPIVLEQISKKELGEKQSIYYYLIIAEQPYSHRMAMQVQRAFDLEIRKKQLPLHVKVEGSGQGISEEVKAQPEKNLPILARINSELGAFMAERYNNARIQEPALLLRTPDILMFSKRNTCYEQLKKKAAEEVKKPAAAEEVAKPAAAQEVKSAATNEEVKKVLLTPK